MTDPTNRTHSDRALGSRKLHLLPNLGESGSGLSDEIGFGLEHPHYMDDINPQDRVQAAKRASERSRRRFAVSGQCKGR
jgi:hypothetical protein